MNRSSLALVCCWWLTALAGCGLADSQVSFLPDRYKQKPPETEAPDKAPDVKALVRDHRAELFAGTTIDSILVGPPHLRGLHWEFCARPVGRGAGGQPLAQLYLVDIDNGAIGDRLPVDAAHWCNHETLQPA